MKSERHEKIIEIVKNYNIETQEELINRLVMEGYKVTQATISRDIRELKLSKATDNRGHYKYIVTNNTDGNSADVYTETLAKSIRRADQAANMVVVHTYAGMAQAVAAGIDTHDSTEILGCVAGDDTILVVLRDENKAKEYYKRIFSLIKN